jgi:glutathione synthase/RimK-type ligase-like ATP-grasp enzyme
MIGLAPIMTMACNGIDLTPLGRELLQRANHSDGATRASALMDVAIILQMKGNAQLALAMQEQALELSQVYRLRRTGTSGIRVLALMCPGVVGDNTPLEFLVENSDIDLKFLYLAPDTFLPSGIPDHDILFVAVGHSERRLDVLNWLANLVSNWPRPVVNLPQKISQLSRDNASALLQEIPGTVVPRMFKVRRPMLQESELAKIHMPFPIILRPVDSHAGMDLAKAENMDDVRTYLSVTASDQFYVAPFVDYRSSDGQFRKYRVAFVDGRPYAGHMAISENWIIHYLNGGMDTSAPKRAEECRFMQTFDEDFAARHNEALRGIAERVGLEYAVMDCAETRDGKLLVFEVDNNAVIHAMDPVEIFPYKKPQFEKIASAFRDMLVRRKKFRD